MKYYLGIDLGTTGTKTLLFDENGNVLGNGYKGYELITPKENFYEQSPTDWYDAVIESTKIATKDFDGEIEGLSLSAQGGSFTFCDVLDDGTLVPLRNAITWLDKRASEEVSEFGEQIKQVTGKNLGSSSCVAKILWVKKNEPDNFNKTKLILSTSDYIYYCLTGKAVIDHTSSAMMGLMDSETLSYNLDLLSFLGLTENNLPKIVTAGEYIGNANDCFLSKAGINGKVKVYAGVHDQIAASLGNNYFSDSELIISTGTTWVVFLRNNKKYEGPFYIRNHPAGGYAYFLSAVSSGTVLEWTKNNYGVDYKEIDSLAKDREIDENLLVYPFISGNGNYRGANKLTYSMQGVSFKHDKGDVFRATMEGVAFEIKQIVNLFTEKGFDIGNIIVTGGATRSDVWMQILSDVLNKPLYLSNQVDGCCFGAYSTAKKGEYGNFEKFEFNGNIVKPNELNTQKYENKFKKYNNLLGE